jgi:hypothetical protein
MNMIPMVQTVTCVAVHGETDLVTAQRVLDEKSRRETVIVNGAPVPLPVDSWPKVQCDVTAVFQSVEGSRLDVVVRDWDVAAGLSIGLTARFSLTEPAKAAVAAVAG